MSGRTWPTEARGGNDADRQWSKGRETRRNRFSRRGLGGGRDARSGRRRIHRQHGGYLQFCGRVAHRDAVLAGTAADAVQVRMGFAFQFYNKEYSQACISSSGLVGFGTCVSSRANIGFAGARPPGDAAVAAVFWGNLGFSDSGADAVYYQTLGTAPNRRFVVQWNNAMLGSTGQMVTFQAVFPRAATPSCINTQTSAGRRRWASATRARRPTRVSWSFRRARRRYATVRRFSFRRARRRKWP